MDFHAGEIHAILGENGAGKSTLMHLLSGLYQPDAGVIYLNGKPQIFSSPRSARASGIAMVHQHFMLVPTLTIAENVILALSGNVTERIKKSQTLKKIAALARQYGISFDDLNARISTLPVGVQQRVEILKSLATRARILILDEPTAVLTPLEVNSLFASLQNLKHDGYLILLITHKIPEVLAISDRLSILRRGQLIATQETKTCAVHDLIGLMMEEKQSAPASLLTLEAPPRIPSVESSPLSPLLTAQHISTTAESGGKPLQNISFTLYTQEILGIAGVDGNGQLELAEILMGLRLPQKGSLQLNGQPLIDPTPEKLHAAGVAIIPQDRRREGLALSMSVAENLLLNTTLLSRLRPKGVLSPTKVRRLAQEHIERFSITPPFPDQPAAALSGGNQQRVVLAREFSTHPRIVIATNPSRGLDLGATQYVHLQLQTHRLRGAGIILISTDLDEVLSLSDRVYVLYQGSLLGPVAPTTNRENLGALMSGLSS
ncbi:MAG: ABC transporter ATP-binding protein [Deltaproteobacteria bacterium]|nr:ABC transporter ATP-binding protein [Deltaproteobacteria bacterium]